MLRKILNRLQIAHHRLRRSFQLLRVTRRYYRAKQIPVAEATYYIEGVAVRLLGPNHLPLVLDAVVDDSYGLRDISGEITSIIDVGANIGVFAIFAHVRWPHARILAVEPSSDACNALIENLAGTGAEVARVAVGVHKGFASLSIPQDSTAATIYSPGAETTNEDCEVVDFAALTDRFPTGIDLLKLDCEGGEYAVINSPTLDRVRRIRGELHRCAAGRPEVALRQLSSRGFKIIKWQPFADGTAGIVWADRETISLTPPLSV